jgi:release factor glutamine methyltransferase
MKTKSKQKAEGSVSSFIRPTSAFEVLTRATQTLAAIEFPRLTAEVLLAHVLGVTRTQLLTRPEQAVSAADRAQYEQLAARAAEGEPLAYLGGQREFYGLDFFVDPRVLVPRPETELLVELALKSISEFAKKAETAEKDSASAAFSLANIVDVGTGSGCLAVTLAVKLPQARVTALDVSGEALAVAGANAERHGVLSRITFIQSDLLSGLRPPTFGYQLLVANLPYIASGELGLLPVSQHEPRLALDGGPDGLALIRRLLADAPRVMARGGCALMEIAATQAAAATALARAAFPSAQVTVHKDWAGLERAVEINLT